MKFKFEFIAGVAYIFFITGLAVTHEPAEWWFTFLIFSALATPFILGYIAGRGK